MERGGQSPSLGSDAAGATDASGTPISFRLGEANGDEFRRIAGLHPHQYGVLAILLRVLERLRTSSEPDFLAATSRMTSPVLNLIGGTPFGIDIGDDTPSDPLPAIVPQGRARGRAAARRCRLIWFS